MTLNLQSKFQALFILKTFFFFIQAVIIIDVTNFNVEKINILFFEVSDQVMIFLDVEVSLFKNFIYMLFKNVTSFISVILTESEIISSVSTFNDHMKKQHLNSMMIFNQHEAIIMNIMTSLFHSFSDYINIIVESLLKTWCYIILNEKIESICADVKKEER